MTATLNIVGCGRLGTALARAWNEEGGLRIGCVLNQSPESSQRAVDAIGAGRAITSAAELDPAEVTLIATPDSAIADTCAKLAVADRISAQKVVFHASGALSSQVLASAQAVGAHVASAHPIRSFADPETASGSLDGTFCGLEGDAAALRVLRPALAGLGMELLEIDAAAKTLYHAGASIASNYFVTLFDAALRCYDGAGIPREVASRIVASLAQGTATNVARLGPVDALTGPVARGELDVIGDHLGALERADTELCRLYRALAVATLPLARAQGTASPARLDALALMLQSKEASS